MSKPDLVLDPNVKDLYCCHRWDKDQYDAGIKCLEGVVSDSLSTPSPLWFWLWSSTNTTKLLCQKQLNAPILQPNIKVNNPFFSLQTSYLHLFLQTEAPSQPTHQYGGSYLVQAVQSLQQENLAESSPRDKLARYLKSGPESAPDVIGWWGVSVLPSNLISFSCANKYCCRSKVTQNTRLSSVLHVTILPFKVRPHLPSVLLAVVGSQVLVNEAAWRHRSLKHFKSSRVRTKMGISQLLLKQQSTSVIPDFGF